MKKCLFWMEKHLQKKKNQKEKEGKIIRSFMGRTESKDDPEKYLKRRQLEPGHRARKRVRNQKASLNGMKRKRLRRTKTRA